MPVSSPLIAEEGMAGMGGGGGGGDFEFGVDPAQGRAAVRRPMLHPKGGMAVCPLGPRLI